MIKPLSNAVFFRFTDDAAVTTFSNKTKTGIMIAGGDQSNIPRWGKVLDIGPEVRDIAVGDNILVEAGMWTAGFEANGKRVWKTDEDKVMLVSDEPFSMY
jgi:co-chaperonin GroES (HSP10)